MKPVRNALLIFMLVSLSLSAKAQSLNCITHAVITNDIPFIEKQFDENVEIAIENKCGEYSRSQGAILLKSFFSTHQPKRIVDSYQGSSPQGSRYLIGKLITSFGDFRMYLYAKNINGSLVLREIRFDNK